MDENLNSAVRKALRKLGADAMQFSYDGKEWIARALPDADKVEAAVKAELAGKSAVTLDEAAAVRQRVSSRPLATGRGRTVSEALERALSAK